MTSCPCSAASPASRNPASPATITITFKVFSFFGKEFSEYFVPLPEHILDPRMTVRGRPVALTSLVRISQNLGNELPWARGLGHRFPCPFRDGRLFG